LLAEFLNFPVDEWVSGVYNSFAVRDEMLIETVVVGPLQVNCYVVGCETTGEAIVIDPGDEAEWVAEVVRHRGWTVRRIVNTHAHFDHLGGVRELKELTGAPFALHEAELPLVQSFVRQALFFGFRVGDPPEVDDFLAEGDEVAFGEVRLKVLHTPGHSPGGISLVGDGVVFVGDELFAGSIGRTDLPGGDYETLINSVRTKLFTLEDDTIVYPGHGPATTIGRERRYNPFFLGD